MKRIAVVFSSLFLTAVAYGESPAGQARSFIACPVYRDADSGPKSGCWLATDRESGEQFDISASLSKPQLGKAVLVEGVIAQGGEEFCGATVLQPVRSSVLAQPCPKHLIPAEGYSGRVFRLPGAVMRPTEVPRELPSPPFENKSYSILFNFQSDFLNYQYSEVILEEIALYIKASKPKRVRIKGFAATEGLSVSGEVLREPLSLAKRRADMVRTALLRLGVEPSLLKIAADGNPSSIEHYAGGLAEETKRRVDIHIEL